MHELNFLPTEEQKTVKKDSLMFALKNLSVWGIVVALVVIALLVSAQIVLKRQLENWTKQSDLVSEQKLILADRVTTLNNELEEVDQIQQGFVPWSRVLIHIAQLVPDGNRIDSFSVAADSGLIKIKGYARERKNVLNFEEQLKASPIVDEVKSPLSNLLNSVDITYEFEVTINQDNFDKLP